jgi:hypothetical protein
LIGPLGTKSFTSLALTMGYNWFSLSLETHKQTVSKLFRNKCCDFQTKDHHNQAQSNPQPFEVGIVIIFFILFTYAENPAPAHYVQPCENPTSLYQLRIERL